MFVTEPRNSQGLPLFSQSLEAQRSRQLPPLHDEFFVPQTVLFSLPALVMGVLLIAARPNIAQTNKNASGAKLSGRTQNGETTRGTNDSGRRPMEFYRDGVRGNMFSPPQFPQTVIKEPIAVKFDPPQKQTTSTGGVLLPINPLKDWAYTGVVTMGASHMALLENVKSKDGVYVRQGDSFMGAKVGAITEQSITLIVGGKPQSLAKSDMINITPLSANAPFLQGGGQPGQPQPGPMNPSVFQPTLNSFPTGAAMDTTFLPMQNLGEAEQAMIRSAVTNAVNESVREEIVK